MTYAAEAGGLANDGIRTNRSRSSTGSGSSRIAGYEIAVARMYGRALICHRESLAEASRRA